MTAPLIVALPGNEALADTLAKGIGGEIARVVFHRFPDEESYVRFDTPVTERSVILAGTLDRPDAKLLPLLFAVRAARELGAARVGLVAPYLAYMRQDRRFRPGEAVTSHIFADIISRAFDWLVTVDPHLHRISSLEAIYSIPCRTLHAAPLISRWIQDNVPSPVLIGPDDESAQWVEAVASAAGAPHAVLRKIRRGDKDVEVSLPEIERWRDRTPVLVDDIVSTARTMIETLGHLDHLNMRPAICIGVHAVFAGDAYQVLRAAHPKVIVTTNTITHETNGIDICPLVIDASRELASIVDA